MRRKLSFLLVGVILALALIATGAPASAERGRAASVCSKLTVNAGRYGGKQTVRVVLIGRVSCAHAHGLVGSFYHMVASGRCEGAHCNVRLPGGWDCSFFSAAESRETGGAISGCFHTSREKIRLYPTKGEHAPKASCNRVVEYRPGLFSDITEYVGMSCAEARNVVLTHNLSGDGTVPGFECRADPHVQVAGGGAECVSRSARVKWTNA